MNTALSVLAFALVASATPVIEETRHQQQLREHYHHLSYIADFSCHHPQPRTVPVHELLSPYQTRGKAYFPEVTVLHRCDVFAGCCEGAKKCGPLHADNVHLPFKVTYLEDMGDKHKGDWEMEYAHFDNHTICGCKDQYGHIETESHYAHEDHDHKDHHKHEDHDHEHHKHEEHDHHYHEDLEHKRPVLVYKEQYPPLVKDPVRKESYRPDDESYGKGEKRPEQKYDNKKIESLYISI